MQQNPLHNLAYLHSFEASEDEPLCPCCYATLRFNLATPDAMHSIDLRTVFECLKVAQEQHAMPILDTKWWNLIWSEHG